MERIKFSKISIVTPSFNQAEFLEDTINSVLLQNYPNLEYIIIDGGSTDGSVDIIKKYADKLAWWVSEPDKGHGDALNKGFSHATGEIMGWINSDDKYFPWTFHVIGEIFSALPRLEWLTSNIKIMLNRKGLLCQRHRFVSFGKKAFFQGKYLPNGGNCMPQESTFWKKSLWKRAGAHIDVNRCIVPDFELWARFWQHSKLFTVSVPLGAIRIHKEQISTSNYDMCCEEAIRIWHRYGGRFPSATHKFVKDIFFKMPIIKDYIARRNNIFYKKSAKNKWYFFRCAFLRTLRSRVISLLNFFAEI